MSVRQNILLQMLAIVPLMLFLVLYGSHNIFQNGVVIMLGIIVIHNLYRYFTKQNIIHYSLWSILVGSFLVYAFVGLGNTQVPQTSTTISAQDSPILFEFNTSTAIDKMCYFVGIDKDVHLVFEYQKRGRWQKFYTYANSYPYSFRWRCVDTGIHTSKILLRVTKNQMDLNEVRFLSSGKNIPYVTPITVLNDEPKMQIDTTYYSGMYFDEIYHGRTAYEIMKGQRVYENTHPYLGKLLIIPGITLFGMTPFGWRVSNVCGAGLLVFVIYLFALAIFREKKYAFGAAFLMTYSFMHIAQARMAHIDTFAILFILLSYLFLYQFIVKEKHTQLFYSGLFFGLAAAVKWAAIFTSIGYILLLCYLIVTRHVVIQRFTLKKVVLYGLFSYGIIAGIVYLMTFPQMYQNTGGLQQVIDYNLNMYHYHATLVQTHPYSSPWWSWPLDIKPMGYYKQYNDEMLSTISAFGNPAIFWVGIIAIAYLLVRFINKQTLEIALIVFAFVGLYLPYIFIGRLMFIYHFYYAVPFLMLAIVAMFKDMMEKYTFMKYVYIAYLTTVVGLFMAFYPVLSGYSIEQSYVDNWLRWFHAWWF